MVVSSVVVLVLLLVLLMWLVLLVLLVVLVLPDTLLHTLHFPLHLLHTPTLTHRYSGACTPTFPATPPLLLPDC